jgi:hypothetical protein
MPQMISPPVELPGLRETSSSESCENMSRPSACNTTRNATPAVSRSTKSQYSEAEVAVELGITVDALRKMIRSHVVDRDEDLHNVPATSFQPSDLLILRLLAGMAPRPLPQS